MDDYITHYLPWTARAETPAFSILRANSTVFWEEFRSRILHVTGVSKFLFNVVKIWIEEFRHLAKHGPEMKTLEIK